MRDAVAERHRHWAREEPSSKASWHVPCEGRDCWAWVRVGTAWEEAAGGTLELALLAATVYQRKRRGQFHLWRHV